MAVVGIYLGCEGYSFGILRVQVHSDYTRCSYSLRNKLTRGAGILRIKTNPWSAGGNECRKDAR